MAHDSCMTSSNFSHPERRVPQWYIDSLFRKHHYRMFTTQDAVQLYLDQRKPNIRSYSEPHKSTYWPEMNARNALSCMVQLRILWRLRRGVYRFVNDSLSVQLRRQHGGKRR